MLPGKPAIEVISLANQTDVTTRLVSGSIDAMIRRIHHHQRPGQDQGQLELLGDLYDSAQQGIAIAKDRHRLCRLIEKVMNKLIEDGTYTQILTTWNNGRPRHRSRS